MSKIKWYKRYPKDALNGFMGLSLEERGAYCTVLELMYERDGDLPDDDRFIAGWMMADVRVWRRIKKRLIDLGKLHISDGKLTNQKAEEEVLSALSRVGSARDAGRASAASRSAKSKSKTNENRQLALTVDEAPVSTPVSTNQNQNQKEESKLSSDAREECDEVFDHWRRVAVSNGNPAVMKITPERKTACRARLREDGLSSIKQAIDKIPASNFLSGRSGNWSGADIDFLLRPDSVTKILEGKYDNRSKAADSGGSFLDYMIRRERGLVT